MGTRFSAYDYENFEGRPHHDENRIHDRKGSRCMKKLIITKDEDLHLKTKILHLDDDMNTNDSTENRRCNEANDLTVQIRG